MTGSSWWQFFCCLTQVKVIHSVVCFELIVESGVMPQELTGPPNHATVNPLRLASCLGVVAVGQMSMGVLTTTDVVRFFTDPSLWTGLALTAVFLAAAVRLRRYREPI